MQQVHELYARGQYADALPVAKELRKRAFHHFGSPSPVFASAVNNQALVMKALGQLEEASNLFELALLNYESGIGKRQPTYATCLANMAACQLGMQKYDEARKVYEEVLLLRKEILPADHQDIAMVRTTLNPELVFKLFHPFCFVHSVGHLFDLLLTPHFASSDIESALHF